MSNDWTVQEAVALRDLLSRVSESRLREVFSTKCPAQLTADIAAKTDTEQFARIAAIKAGWDAAVDQLFVLAAKDTAPQLDPGFQDVTT